MALWSGFVIKNPSSGSIYFAGDTGYGCGPLFRFIIGAHSNSLTKPETNPKQGCKPKCKDEAYQNARSSLSRRLTSGLQSEFLLPLRTERALSALRRWSQELVATLTP